MSIYTEEARRLALCLIKDRPMGMSLAEAGQVILDALGMPAQQAAHPAPAEGDGLARLLKRLVRQVSDASYTQGIEERHNSAARDEKNDNKVRALLGEASAAIDRLAALSAPQPKGTAAGAAGEAPGWLHVRGQFSHHGEAAIAGTRLGLELLRAQVGAALAGGPESQGTYFASDGEGYELAVELLSDEAFAASNPSYIMEACDKSEAYWRDRAFDAEAKLHRLKNAAVPSPAPAPEAPAEHWSEDDPVLFWQMHKRYAEKNLAALGATEGPPPAVGAEADDKPKATAYEYELERLIHDFVRTALVGSPSEATLHHLDQLIDTVRHPTINRNLRSMRRQVTNPRPPCPPFASRPRLSQQPQQE